MEGKKKITSAEVNEEVNRIRKLVEQGDDGEEAHEAEDRLYWRVLHTIAHSPKLSRADIEHMADLALQTQQIDFGRHCA